MLLTGTTRSKLETEVQMRDVYEYLALQLHSWHCGKIFASSVIPLSLGDLISVYVVHLCVQPVCGAPDRKSYVSTCRLLRYTSFRCVPLLGFKICRFPDNILNFKLVFSTPFKYIIKIILPEEDKFIITAFSREKGL